MKIVDRLLTREEIDSLELDLAKARGRDPRSVESIRTEIERLEQLLRMKKPANKRQSQEPHSG